MWFLRNFLFPNALLYIYEGSKYSNKMHIGWKMVMEPWWLRFTVFFFFFFFTTETEMMSEVEAIRGEWRAVHVCQKDEEKSRDFLWSHIHHRLASTYECAGTHTRQRHSCCGSHYNDSHLPLGNIHESPASRISVCRSQKSCFSASNNWINIFVFNVLKIWSQIQKRIPLKMHFLTKWQGCTILEFLSFINDSRYLYTSCALKRFLICSFLIPETKSIFYMQLMDTAEKEWGFLGQN